MIPADHLLAVALDKGPSGKDLDFTYQSRDSEKLVGAAVMHITEFFAMKSAIFKLFSVLSWRETTTSLRKKVYSKRLNSSCWCFDVISKIFARIKLSESAILYLRSPEV